MAKITGLGGVFFKVEDPSSVARFFTEKLEVPTETWGRMFEWRELEDPEKKGCTVMGIHRTSSDYFDPSPLPFMLNFRVDDLDAVLAKLRERGVEIVKVFDPDENGRFAHVLGPAGIKIELWQPADQEPSNP
ncbi:MAG: VOC family protein [Polyangiaceae bacterium]